MSKTNPFKDWTADDVAAHNAGVASGVAAAIVVPEEKRNKYGNEKTGDYASKKEAERAGELKFMMLAGKISELVEHPEYEIVPKQKGERAVKYVADFRYIENGEQVVEDVKSEATRKNPTYIIKRKLMLHVHDIRVLQT